MKNILIIGSAPCDDCSYIKQYADFCDFIIAADGGRKIADELNLTVDYYVGDSDSGGYDNLVPSDILPSEKDVTDLDMGISRALALGCGKIILTGCTGGRQDHHFSAIGQLERIYLAGKKAIIADEMNEIEFISAGETILKYNPNFRYFGIVPLDFTLEGVTIRNAKYEAENIDVTRISSLTISNEQLENKDTFISIKSGSGLVIRSFRQ